MRFNHLAGLIERETGDVDLTVGRQVDPPVRADQMFAGNLLSSARDASDTDTSGF